MPEPKYKVTFTLEVQGNGSKYWTKERLQKAMESNARSLVQHNYLIKSAKAGKLRKQPTP